MAKRTKDTWEAIEADFREACTLSCKPGSEFPKLKEGQIIDEEKSVRWNREENERLRNAYLEEVKRLNRVKNEAMLSIQGRAIAMIAKETRIKKEQAERVWRFVYDRHHHDGSIFQNMDEYVELVKAVRD